MMDRAKLEEAITASRDWSLNEQGARMERFLTTEQLAALTKAAEAHLATLPEPMIIQVWRVEWQAGGTRFTEDYRYQTTAKEVAQRLLAHPECREIAVSGPHHKEVPA
jgi:hypothetical protein